MIADCHPTQATIFINFLVVNTPSIYGVIIGQSTLNVLRAVALTYHLKMKFLIAIETGVVYSNQVETCYALVLKVKGNSCQ